MFQLNTNDTIILQYISKLTINNIIQSLQDSTEGCDNSGHWMTNSSGTCKQHASGQHLSQDAASGPHVYGLGIVVGGQEQAGGTIPFSYQTLR